MERGLRKTSAAERVAVVASRKNRGGFQRIFGAVDKKSLSRGDKKQNASLDASTAVT